MILHVYQNNNNNVIISTYKKKIIIHTYQHTNSHLPTDEDRLAGVAGRDRCEILSCVRRAALAVNCTPCDSGSSPVINAAILPTAA